MTIRLATPTLPQDERTAIEQQKVLRPSLLSNNTPRCNACGHAAQAHPLGGKCRVAGCRCMRLVQ